MGQPIRAGAPRRASRKPVRARGAAPRPAGSTSEAARPAFAIAYVVAATALAGGCQNAGLGPVGSSPPRAPDRTLVPAETDASAPLTGPAAAMQAAPLSGPLTRATGRFLSRGHGERFDAVVWGNATALAAMNGHRPWPDGAVWAEETAAARGGDGGDAGDQPTGVLVMEKRSGAWQFAAVQADGAVVRDRRVAPCAACHRDATDFVFPFLP